MLKSTSTVNIHGPAGNLEARSTTVDPNPVRFAVLCHPHPQYGGNMHDGVLARVESALLGIGVSCLRFNFRGVGASAGSHTGGTGEAADLLAVIAWLEAQHDETTVWLGGYSFGANIVWRSLDDYTPERVILVAPPTGVMEFSDNTLGQARDVATDAFAGDQDEYLDLARLTALEGVDTHVIAGGDHFFTDRLDALEQAVREVCTVRQPG